MVVEKLEERERLELLVVGRTLKLFPIHFKNHKNIQELSNNPILVEEIKVSESSRTNQLSSLLQ